MKKLILSFLAMTLFSPARALTLNNYQYKGDFLFSLSENQSDTTNNNPSYRVPLNVNYLLTNVHCSLSNSNSTLPIKALVWAGDKLLGSIVAGPNSAVNISWDFPEYFIERDESVRLGCCQGAFSGDLNCTFSGKAIER
jgi:hypothetical protein